MTAVVLVGDLPATGIVQASTALRVGVPASRADGPAFIDQVAQCLHARSAVLVLSPAWRSAEALAAVRLARAALDTDRIAFLPLDLPPLALSLVADQVTFAAPYVQPGVLASLADRLAREVYTGAWLNSVARLERIETAFSLHVKSYLPGAGFAVTAAPAQQVHRISSAAPVPPIDGRPVDPVIMLVCHSEGGDLEWVKGRLAPALAVTSLTEVGPQPLSPEFWGSKKYAEFVAFSGHPQVMQATLASMACRPCRWCGEPTALAQCPFCWMVQPEPPGPEYVQGGPSPGHVRPPDADQQPVAPRRPARPRRATPGSPQPGGPQSGGPQRGGPQSGSPPPGGPQSGGPHPGGPPHGNRVPGNGHPAPGNGHAPPGKPVQGSSPVGDTAQPHAAASAEPVSGLLAAPVARPRQGPAQPVHPPSPQSEPNPPPETVQARPQSATANPWPYPATPAEAAAVRPGRSDEGYAPHAEESPVTRPQFPGTAGRTPASEAAVPEQPERPDHNATVSFRPAKHR